MKPHARRTTAVFAFALLLLAAFATVQLHISAEPPRQFPADDVQAIVRAVIKRSNIAGLSIAIVQDRKLAWASGYGFTDVRKKIPAGPSSLFRVASITKLFTSLSVMMLSMQGELGLDEPLQSYFPEFKVGSNSSWAGEVTIRHLLTHTSGLPENVYGLKYDQLPSSLGDVRMKFEPGTGFLYSNLGFDLLGELIERVTRTPYVEYLENTVIQPLGMDHSYFWVFEEKAPVAVGYEKGNGGFIPVSHVGYWGNIPSASLCSSVEDLSNFVRFILDGGTFDGRPLLDGSLMREMIEDNAYSRGLGFAILSSGDDEGRARVVGHHGATMGYSSVLMASPDEGTGVVILANTGGVAGDLIELGSKMLGFLRLRSDRLAGGPRRR